MKTLFQRAEYMWQRPGISIKRGIALLMIVPTASYGAPQGGQIVGGTAAISQQGNTTTVTQGSDRVAIDWASFNVGRNELVQFLQPSSGSVALNRILDSNPSLVLGRVQANGQLFLVNPRGIIFGDGAQINTAGLVASALDIAPQEFMQGGRVNAQAVADSAGVIVNQGLIEASVGGSVTLLGRVIRQDGEIRAERGRVQLIAADRAIIQFDSLGGLGIEVTQAVQQNNSDGTAQIDVAGKISADGGYILLDGKSAAGLFDHAVNVSGIVEAKSFESANGVIELKGDGSAVAVTGRLDASAGAGNDAGNGGTVSVTSTQQAVIAQQAHIDVSSTSGRGGVIEIKADQRVGVLDQATLDAHGAQGGVVHIGGDYQGSGNLTADRTVVGRETSIDVSATAAGNGGEVIVWADDYTYFAGNIAARGGALSGNGGFVEVSGKNSLAFTGSVDTSAIYGEFGELLLDPAVINIINGSGGAQSGGVADGVILAGDAPSPYTISEQALEALTSNVTLTATQAINIANLADNELLFNPNGGTVTFNIDATSGTASFTMADVNDTIRVNNGNLVIDGTGVDSNISFTLGNLATTTAGNITLNASATCTSTPFISACDGGAVTMSSGSIRSAGGVTINGDSTGVGVTTFFFPFFIQGNGGSVTFDFGDIAANGAVSIDAVSNATGSPAGSSSTSITVDDILVSNNSAIQITADSAQNASLENVYIGGNYLTGGGNITISSNTLNLTANALIDSSVFGSGGAVSIPSAGNRVLNGHTLSLGVDNIYVGDISGSAGAADLGFSQADIDLFSGSTLTLRALGNIAVGNATITGPTSALQLVADRDNSTSGDLSIASGKTLDLSGRNLTASGRNATIDGSIVNSGTGTEQITTTIAFNLGSGASLASGSGNISLNSGAGITMASNASISSTSGQVALNAANNIALGNLSTGNATTSAVTIASTAGAISNAGATTNIAASAVGSRVNLSAVSGINSSMSAANLSLTNSTSGTVTLTNDRALQVTSFTNTPVTASSITTTGVGSDLTIAGNVASGSNLSLISSGAVTVNNGATVNSNTGTLSINATGNAAITGLTTTNNTASAVSVISGGAITDNGNTNNDITATQANAVVTLQAASGIGAASALDLSISRLALTNSTSGAANITNNRALQVNSFTNTPATTASIITTGVSSDLTIAGNVASGSNLSLTSSGAVTINDGTTVNSNAGTLSINATGNAAITGLTTTNNTASAVSVISGGAITDNGDTAADIIATQTNAVVTLQAASGIGAANALDLSIARLALTNSTSGATNITNNRALQINSFTNTPVTAASITTTGVSSDLTIAGNVASGSNLSLISGGAVTINDGTTVNSNAGTLSINATGNAAITGLTTTNNTASAVSVISGGAITDNGDTAADITATQANAVVTLQAASGIGAANALDLSISRLALTNSTSGAANITNNRALQINSFTNTPVTAASIVTTGVSSDLTIAGNVASGSNLSLTSSGALSVTDGFTVNSNAGTLSINASGNAAITGLTTTNNTASAVSVISGGAITDNGNTNVDITATQANAVVTLQAANGVGAANALDLSISRLALTNSTSGAANITNNRALQINSFTNIPVTAASIATTGVSSDLTIAGNVASGSNLSLISGGAVTINDGTTVNSNAGTLSINATGNAAITGLTTTNNTASAVSVISGGAITDNGDTNTDITATQASAVVTLQAASGIGAANVLDLSISRLALTNSTSGAANITNNRALQINSFTNTPVTAASITTTGVSSDLTIAGNVSSGSNLSLASSGALSVTDGFTVNSNAGTLSINAAGNAAITGLTTTNNTASAVSVISGGAITDNGNTNTDITATQANAVVTLQAASGIGAANALDLSISRLALTNSTSGAANITNNRALQINSFTNTPVTAASITTTGVSSDLTIAGNVASGSNLSLISSGALSVTDGFTVNSNAGTLSINAAGNAAITGLTTTNNTTSAVSVISGGAITDNGNTNADITATQANAVVTLQAASGIGSANALETNIGTLAVSNTTSGNIAVSDVSALQLNNISNAGGNIGLDSIGTMTVNSGSTVSTNGSGTLTLTANAGDIAIAGNIGTASGALTLSADQSILQGAASSVSSGSGAIALTADADSDDVGEILQTDGAQIVSTTGAISLSAAEDITLAHVQTGSGSSSAIAITSALGGIVDAGDTAIDIVATNSGAVVTMQAMTGIGNGNAIETAIENLLLHNGASGDVAINNTGVLRTISTVNSSGKVDLQSSGDIYISGVQSASTADDAIRVTSTGGAIVDNADVQRDLITAGGAVLTAATGMGSANALDTNVSLLAASNSTSGNIVVNDISALQLDDVSNSGGDVNISSNGAMQVNSGRTVSTTGSNTLTLTANAADLVIAGSIATAAGALVLSADQSVLQGAGSTVSSGAGAISLTADADSDDVGEIAQTDGAQIVSTSGTLLLQAAEDIALAHLQTGNNTSSAVNVTSTLGAIVDAGDTQTDIVANASGSLVTLSAVTGIGNGNAIETAIANLALQNSVSGDVAIANTGAISTSDLVNSGGKVDLSATGDITLTGVQSASTASDAINIASGGAIIDNGNVVSDLVTTGGVVLSAVAGIGSGNALETAIANVALLNSGSGDVDIDNTGNISTASLVNSNGKIDLRATGNIALTGVQSASIASDAISVTSSSGAIIDNGNTVSDLITTGGVVLASATGIGSANALEIAAGQVAANNTGGAIDIANASAASLSVAQQGTGNVRYVAAGGINASSITTQGGAITLQNTAGDIRVGTVGSSGGNVQLSSADNMAVTQQISSNGGAVSLVADNDTNGTGGIAFATAAGINAGSGTITLTATQDIALTGVTTTSNSASALAVATQGAVIDAGDSTRDLSVQNGGVVINAGSIGDGNALESRINTLDAMSAGNVFINNTGPLQVVRLVAANAALTNTGDIAVNGNGIDVSGSLTLAGAGSIDVSNTTLGADSMNISAAGDLRLHGTLVDGISNISLVADSDQDGNGNIDFDIASTLFGHGATQAQLTANRITLQSVQGISSLAITGDDASFDQSLTADSITVEGATSVGSGVVLVADSMTFDDVLLGANASLTGSNVISMGNLSLGRDGQNTLQAAQLSATTITGIGAALGIVATATTVDTLDLTAGSSTPGSLTVVADAQTADSLLTFGSVDAGDVSVTGLGTFERGVQIGSAATVGALTIASMSTTSLMDIDAQRQIDIASDNLTLGGNLAAGNAVALRGATQLATDIGIVSGRAGESTGGVLIAGTLAGNAHALTIDAGNNVMCSDDAVMTSLSSLTVTDSIKTVLGEIEAQELVINARQEIYLNRNISAQSMRLNADSNNDDIGAIFRFKDALLAVDHIDASGSIFSSATRANCDFPVCAPVVPSFSDIARERMVAEQEAGARESGISDAFFAGQLKVSYLDADCVDEDESSSAHCRQKRSMYDFLGTFLINNQLPAQ